MILEAGGGLLVPDFVFTHADGTEVALEIVGYWTRSTSPASSASWGGSARPTSWSRCGGPWPSRPAPCPRRSSPFTTRILLRDLMPQLETFRRPPRRDR